MSDNCRMVGCLTIGGGLMSDNAGMTSIPARWSDQVQRGALGPVRLSDQQTCAVVRPPARRPTCTMVRPPAAGLLVRPAEQVHWSDHAYRHTGPTSTLVRRSDQEGSVMSSGGSRGKPSHLPHIYPICSYPIYPICSLSPTPIFSRTHPIYSPSSLPLLLTYLTRSCSISFPLPPPAPIPRAYSEKL